MVPWAIIAKKVGKSEKPVLASIFTVESPQTWQASSLSHNVCPTGLLDTRNPGWTLFHRDKYLQMQVTWFIKWRVMLFVMLENVMNKRFIEIIMCRSVYLLRINWIYTRLDSMSNRQYVMSNPGVFSVQPCVIPPRDDRSRNLARARRTTGWLAWFRWFLLQIKKCNYCISCLNKNDCL